MTSPMFAVLPLFNLLFNGFATAPNEAYVFTQIVAPFEGTDQTLAFGINDLGWIVGQYHNSSGGHGYLLKNGQFTPIDAPVPGAVDVDAMGINLQGQIVGSYFGGDGSRHAFLLSSGQYTTIDAPSPSATLARGINNQGEVVGSYEDEHGSHGFLWTRGVFKTIDVPFAGAHDTGALGINSLGLVVGGYTGGDGLIHGFIFHQGHFSRLDEPGAVVTLPYGVNNWGQIVGTNFIFDHGHFKDLSGTPENPAPNEAMPLAINDFGLVLALGDDVTGQEASFLAVPVRSCF